MSKRLIQDDTLKLLADNARRITGSNKELCGAEILEIMSRTQGTIKTSGEFTASVLDDNGNIIKSGNYDTGEAFAMPLLQPKEDKTFQCWTCTSLLISDSYTIVENSDIKAAPIYIQKDNKFTIRVNILEPMLFYIYNIRPADNNSTVINWGDGTIEYMKNTNNNCHDYTTAGIYNIEISGEFKKGYSDYDQYQLFDYLDIHFQVEDIQISNNINLNTIPSYFFYNCSSLKNVNIPNNIISIERRSFSSCSSLEYIAIPPSVTTLGENVFADCVNLKEVILPYGITEISKGLFYNCNSLSEVIIPDSVTTIGKLGFAGSVYTSVHPENLKTLILPSVTYLGKQAFGGRVLENLILLANQVCETDGDIFGESNINLDHYDFEDKYNLYVPDNLVNSYKAHIYWSTLSSRIKPLSSYNGGV